MPWFGHGGTVQRLDTLYVITCIYIYIYHIKYTYIHIYIYIYMQSTIQLFTFFLYIYIYIIIYTATRLFWRGTIYLDVACVYGKLHVCVCILQTGLDQHDWVIKMQMVLAASDQKYHEMPMIVTVACFSGKGKILTWYIRCNLVGDFQKQKYLNGSQPTVADVLGQGEWCC